MRLLTLRRLRVVAAAALFAALLPTPTFATPIGDDGPGVSPEDRDRIFERFVRLDSARTRDTGGTGLGLAIVNDVVTSHHGTITITDGDLGGATFTVEIPTSQPGLLASSPADHSAS